MMREIARASASVAQRGAARKQVRTATMRIVLDIARILPLVVPSPGTDGGAFASRGYNRSMLLCPVRDCHMAMERTERRVLCPRGHSFDVARSGYINLLQPQERRSSQPGDTVAAVAARRRLHDSGVTG